MTHLAAPDTGAAPARLDQTSAMTALTTALARFPAASRLRLERLSAQLYDRHADRCTTCCVLGGELCRTGRYLHTLAARFETERTW